MEHDQRVCPRCAAPAGDYRYCPSCRSPIESLMGMPTRAAAPTAEADARAQAPEEVVRLEQALVRLDQAMAAASRMSSDRVAGSAPATALEVDGTPSPGHETTSEGAGVVELRQPRHDVARLEDVLTVASPKSHETIPDTRREPSYVDAQALREAFWFELASARASGSDTEPCPPPQPEALEPRTDSAPETGAGQVVDSMPDSSTDRSAPPESSPSIGRVWAEQTSRGSWSTALCLLALLALVVLLTGRAPRRLTGPSAS